MELLALSMEHLILFGIVFLVLLIIPIIFIYKYAKNKGRLEYLEKHLKETVGDAINLMLSVAAMNFKRVSNPGLQRLTFVGNLSATSSQIFIGHFIP